MLIYLKKTFSIVKKAKAIQVKFDQLKKFLNKNIILKSPLRIEIKWIFSLHSAVQIQSLVPLRGTACAVEQCPMRMIALTAYTQVLIKQELCQQKEHHIGSKTGSKFVCEIGAHETSALNLRTKAAYECI